ncbi:SsgA family sporulation/cell division regulator [Streptomyces sp. BG9H]|uniref:SsgA family sporulation/cell division regulator n=1 Tax=Streptomyces anatolicus TaxID=2675858 RepID=A0ABS6YY96_9ACTN|nr:SsgA family sporulation/cell division regulator [Streptomyces anatolicus]MBW5425471.1 SsgA family sporulation/cell division regulator [Streptomyces anatolicus]
MSAVEQYARAHLVTDSSEGHRAVPVVLHYDGEADPHTVRIGLPGHHEWVFARQLLEQGLRAPVTAGDVHVWPCGRVQTVVEFHARDGVTVVQFDASALIRFLRRTYAAATPVSH